MIYIIFTVLSEYPHLGVTSNTSQLRVRQHDYSDEDYNDHDVVISNVSSSSQTRRRPTKPVIIDIIGMMLVVVVVDINFGVVDDVVVGEVVMVGIVVVFFVELTTVFDLGVNFNF